MSGFRDLAMRVLSAAGVYRRLDVLALPLADAPEDSAAGVDVQELEPVGLDEYLRFRPDADPALLRARFSAGARCFVARRAGRIVHAGWAVARRGWIDYLGCELPLDPGDVLQFDSFTAPAERGQGFARTRITVMARTLRAEGHRRLLALVWPENTAGFRPLTALGYRAVGRIAVIRLGPWRRVRARGVQPPASRARGSAQYWDDVVTQTLAEPPIEAWREYMRGVYAGLLGRWLSPAARGGPGLKTDLFEEAVSPQHVLPVLGAGSLGLDYSMAVVRAARVRLGAGYRFVVGDLRQIPLRASSVARILAGSSLDHFARQGDLDSGLAEIARILAPGGVVVITLDNPRNPLVWLRNHLPYAWLHRIGLVPYYVGHTYGPRQARARIEALGLRVTEVTAVAHVPRAPAIWLAAAAGRLARPERAAGLARTFARFESLESWPTRYWTGYYVALAARKPAPDTVTRREDAG